MTLEQQEREYWNKNQNDILDLAKMISEKLHDKKMFPIGLFLNWKFLKTYSDLFNGKKINDYKTLYESWVWDVIDNLNRNNWQLQRFKNSQAMKQAELNYNTNITSEQINKGIPNVIEAVGNVFSGISTFLIIGLVLFGIYAIKK
ncbi:MAG: hypothetical protein AB1695_14200 [Stygiobacter sp.]